MLKSLRIRLTLIFISLAVGPVLVVGIYLAQRSFTAQQEQSVEFQSQVAQRVASEVDAFLRDVESDLDLLGGELRSLTETDRAQQMSLLLGSLNTGPYRDVYQELRLLDADGHEHLRISREEVISTDAPIDRSQSDEFTQPKTNRETYFSPVWFAEETGEPLVTIAIPLFQRRSVELSGVLVADMRLEAVRNLIADLQISINQTLYLENAAGQVVVHDDPAFVLNKTTMLLPETSGRAQGLSASDVLFATDTVQVGNLTLTVVAERLASEALEVAQDSLTVGRAVTLFALLSAVSLVTLTVWQVVRPIEKLSAVARSIQAGDLSARAEIRSQDEIGILGQSFNDMTSRLQDMIQSLEDRVAERVRDITVASEASRQINTELDSTRLLAQVAQLTASAFNFYHVSIFLFDETDQTLRLRQGTGDIGTQMVAAGKQFRLSASGLVPLAARTRKAAVANDVLQETSHLPNPLLPATRSELAVPMVYQGKLIGVLDLQSEKANRFRDEDIRIINTLAEQIAVAVCNSQLFAELGVALQQAERANAVKSSFLASMSHELRTPLNAVINFTKFVVKGVMGPINERQQQTLNTVISSAQHLLSLINDVLDMSKIESGALNLFVEDNVDLNEILKDATTTAQSLLDEKPVELRLEVRDELPLMVGDRQRLLQIMLNIVSNACKFTENGSITIRAFQENGHVELAVADTGPGIPIEDQPAVFEPFKQTETGLRQGGGTGLGMPISKSLVEAHGGSIRLESTPGQGTTFYVTLPVKSDKLTPSFN
jgi:signal transduction histidine kinase